MKLTRKLLAAMLSVCMVLAILTPASAAELSANYNTASYYDVAVSAYSRMLAFQNGVVAAANTSKQYGLIDYSGKVILPFQYAYVWALGGDKFAVAQKEDNYGKLSGLGIVNSAGKTVLAPSQDCSDVSSKNGVIRVTTRTADPSSSWGGYNYTYAYYTTDWKPSSEAAYEGGSKGSGPLTQYDYVYSVGSFYVVAKSGERYQEGVLNSSYEPVIPLGSVDNVECAVNGDSVAFVVSKDRQYKLVGSDGKDIVPFGVYDDFRVRSQGSSVGVSKDDKMGAIDFTGKVLIPLGDYEDVGGLNQDGYISAVTGNSSSVLFKDGKVAKTFSDKKVTTEVYFRHLAFTTSDMSHGMMDVNGKVILPENYDSIDADSNDYLCTTYMKDDGSYEYLHGLFTQEGQTVIPDTYTEIRILQGSSYVLCKDGSYGLSRISGTTVTPVIPMQYKEMRTHTPQFIELYDGSNYSVVDLNNNVVVPESTEKINAFKGDEGGLWETLDRVDCYAEEYDGYTKSVLPFISKTGNGYLTTYADYKTGKADGQLPVRASNLNDGGWFAYQNANGLYGIGRLSTGFLDIEPESWKDDSASWAAAKKITDGVGGGKFDPDKNCTNAQIITFLYRAKTGNIVSGANWDVDAINWAKEQGMIGDGFDKTQPCTRATALKFIWQAFGSPAPEKASSFTDIPAGADYADAVSWAVGLPTPITNGYGATFGPNDVCSRAHIVTFLYRAYGNS